MSMSATPNTLIFCFHLTSHQTPKGIILSHCLKCLNSFFIILTTAKFCTAFPWRAYLSLKTFLSFCVSWRAPLACDSCSGLILVSLWGCQGGILDFSLSFTPKTQTPACTDQTWVTKKALLPAHNKAMVQLSLAFQGSSTDPCALQCCVSGYHLSSVTLPVSCSDYEIWLCAAFVHAAGLL